MVLTAFEQKKACNFINSVRELAASIPDLNGYIFGERRIGVHGCQKKGEEEVRQESQEKEVTALAEIYMSPDRSRGRYLTES